MSRPKPSERWLARFLPLARAQNTAVRSMRGLGVVVGVVLAAGAGAPGCGGSDFSADPGGSGTGGVPSSGASGTAGRGASAGTESDVAGASEGGASEGGASEGGASEGGASEGGASEGGVGAHGGSGGASEGGVGGQGVGGAHGGSGGASEGGVGGQGVGGAHGGSGGALGGGAGGGGAGNGGSAGSCTAVSWFPDEDGDGFGRTSGKVTACVAPTNGTWVNKGDDCDDDNADVFPNATSSSDEGYVLSGGGVSFDYDCSGTEELDTGQLGAAPTSCSVLNCGDSGFQSTARTGPGVNALCGSKSVLTCSSATLLCPAVVSTVTDGVRCH